MSETKYVHDYISQQFNNNYEYLLTPSELNRNGSEDYLHKVFIKIELPAIYSSSSRQFKWVKDLGYNIIKEVKCNINNTTSLYTYTEWLYIWNELNLSEDEKKIHNELIGNTPELYDPGNALNRNNAYPASHLNKETYRWIIDDNNLNKAYIVNIDEDYNYDKPPSIPSKTLYIPLNFSFSNDINDILSLKKINTVKFEISLRNVEDLYTVLLQPEDFILENSGTNINIDNANFDQNVKLPNKIKFISNKIPYFDSTAHKTIISSTKNDLSMFDILINKYEIKPLTTGNTALHNFLLKPNSSPPENFQVNKNSRDKFYIDICNISIICNFVKYKSYTKSTVQLKGLFNTINISPIFTKIPIGVNSIDQSNETISKHITGKIDEIFLIVRHNLRSEKNDLLNFTNLDHYNKIPWEDNNKNNTISYSSSIQLLTNSIWEHQATSSSIKIGVDNLGVFYIKKHILDNDVFKYVDIINYKSEKTIDNKVSIYNVNSNKYSNEAILEKFKTTIYTDSGSSGIPITTSSESYNFYNKVSLYKKYKNTIPGLYYINKSFNNLSKIEISECSFNKIKINESSDYHCILFCIETKEI